MSCPLWAQQGPSQPNGNAAGMADSDSDVYLVVDQVPEYPGGIGNRPVRVRYSLPIRFKL
ncbi:MAG: hypothetical protein J6Z12_07520 [Paludibacteraceae bacterium]|nr:hypothetical protein [Paludibacteraceae bacterium]